MQEAAKASEDASKAVVACLFDCLKLPSMHTRQEVVKALDALVDGVPSIRTALDRRAKVRVTAPLCLCSTPLAHQELPFVSGLRV